MSRWQDFSSCIRGAEKIILLIHEKPDGDCLGSALALGLGLKSMGMRPSVLLLEEAPEVYRFLPGQELLEVRKPGRISDNIPVVAVDCAEISRMGYEIPAKNPVVNIDHHISNSLFGSLNIVDTNAAATGEIIYRLFLEGGVEITPGMATCLYVALATDTGNFTYSNTTPETFRIAGDLLSLKSDMRLIRENLYETRPVGELLMMKAALETLFFTQNGRIAACVLSYETIKHHHLFETETDSLVGLLRATKGVEIAALFKELTRGEIKVSFRSKDSADVNKLAAEFGGGGHPRAAGCTVKGTLAQVVKDVLAAAEKMIRDGGD
ncbi:MAG: bifunctional oligoribonuclease/PAP phosphatase NrnA [Peptococcaceae bacterium]|nr:bifunctional oligoribonuclease/PAP phosphatase NrnA [Peptococcaceae bacterium]MDH7524087.1 bifunctional oligoribonuclease/PAP phosphatase NrnA [Peptococcaceae bacterium]